MLLHTAWCCLANPFDPPQTNLTALHQASTYVRAKVPAAAPLLPHDLAARAQAVYVKQSQVVSVSQLQRDVKHALSALAAEPNSPVCMDGCWFCNWEVN